MKTTDTPRTDAAIIESDYIPFLFVEASFAKKLEIELNQFRDATKMALDQKPARITKQKKCTFCGGSGWWMDAMGTNSYRCDKCQNPKKADALDD